MESGEVREKMWMIYIDLRKPFPTYKNLKSMMRNYHMKPKL